MGKQVRRFDRLATTAFTSLSRAFLCMSEIKHIVIVRFNLQKICQETTEQVLPDELA